VPTPSQLLFLPGASGNTAFWHPVADQLSHPATRVLLGYPGFGATPADPAVNDIDALTQTVIAHLDQPTAIIAQSMGGILAIRAALARPEMVTHLVLSVTSGGVDMHDLGAKDWRDGFADANPTLPDWFLTYHADLSPDISRITQPTLLLWGNADPLSPVAVGERLHTLLPNARLHVVDGGAHDLANAHAAEVVPLVDAHLARV